MVVKETRRDNLKLRCMTCWQKQGYAKDAPYQDWDKPCKHLKAIGGEIKKKLQGKVQVADEAAQTKTKRVGEEDECLGRLF